MSDSSLTLMLVNQQRVSRLYCLGTTHADFEIAPQKTDAAYLQGYADATRRNLIKANAQNPEFDELYQKTKQGYLWAGFHQLSKKYGKILLINPEQGLKGWAIEIEGLEIWILTFDWEEPELETKWTIYSHQCDCLKLLAEIFDSNLIYRPEGTRL